MPRYLASIALLAALPTVVIAADGPAAVTPTAEQVRFFESQVRPVLVESCLGCHGPAKVKAGLRLDSRASALAGGDSGPAIVAGKPEESPLVAAIKYEGPEMPPKGKLPPKQVEALTQWIRMGAPWPGGDTTPAAASEAPEPASNIRKPGYAVTDADRQHWAFRPLVRPAVPAGKGGAIDAFLAVARESRGLPANPPATRGELIRRVTYDLTGLPPTLAEADAFEADSSPDAYPKLVDRLLDSPRYGEKWGRHWLDLVRYAETNSYERDNAKPNAWRYRDYVIRSFNADKPYDRFLREQIAGDELPDGGIEGQVATGYYRLGLWDDEPADRDQARYDGLDDIVATTGQVFLGLTVDCARCHDHKLDPIPQKDYYRFLSFFQGVNHYRNGGPTDEATIIGSAEAQKAYDLAAADLTRRRDAAQAVYSEIEAEFLTGLAKLDGAPKLAAVDIDELTFRFYRDSFEELPDFDALKPEDTGKLPAGLFDLAPRTRNEAIGFVFEGTLIVPADGRYTFHLDSDDGSRLAVAGAKVVEHDGVHGEGEEKAGTIELKKGRVPIRLDYFQSGHGLGLTVSWSGPGFENRKLSAAPSAAAAEPRPKALAQGEFLREFRKHGVAVLGEARARQFRENRKVLDDLKRSGPEADRALVVTEGGPKAPPTHLLLRGNPHALGDVVEPAFLQVATTRPAPVLPTPGPGARTSGRRTVLADWIASPENPLTARVMANRVWQYHFGRGIARSSNNLGTQGEKPTHPELLDWLASEFVAGGWKLKPLHRLILNSDAYKMSSKAEAKALAADPVNDTFWRFDMRRLTAEEIRDSILAVTGKLNPKMYGPSVYPEIPAEVMAGQSKPGAGWNTSAPADQDRRSVYVHIKRSLLLPILESYDIAETDRSTPVRFATTQPTQALGMLNGSFLNAQASALADRLRREAGPATPDRVAQALRLATGRKPDRAEIDRGVALVEGLVRGGTPADSALETFCLVVLNLDEFIYLN